MASVVAIAGLGLVGFGAHAAFIQTTTSSQTITAGTVNVTLSSTDAASGNGTDAITLNDVNNVASTYTTGDELVTITNNSPFPVSAVSFGLNSYNGTTSADAAIWNESNICLEAAGATPTPLYDGPINAFTSTVTVAPSIAAGGTSTYTVNIYAGDVTTACGAETTASLANDAQGGVLNPTITVTYNG